MKKNYLYQVFIVQNIIKFTKRTTSDNLGIIFMQRIVCELRGSNQLIKKDGYYQCEHCVGEFKDIFNKVCSKCGKPKDY